MTKTKKMSSVIVVKTNISFIDFSIVRNRMPKLGKITDTVRSRLIICIMMKHPSKARNYSIRSAASTQMTYSS